MPYHPRELPDISRHVTTFAETVFEDRAQGRGGAEYNLVCPFCGGEEAAPKKKLYLNRKTGLWICFRCEKKGTFPWLVKQMAKDDPDINAEESVERADQALLLAKTAGGNRAISWDPSVTTGVRLPRLQLDDIKE